MPDSQIRTKEGRGGLSRSAAKAVAAARRRHNDDLIASVFGPNSVAQHFKDHALDGETIISAVPEPGKVSSRPEPVPTMSASDPVANTADWFKGGKGEGDRRSTPDAVRPTIPRAPDVVKAIEQVQSAIGIEQTLGVDVPVGVSGGDYQVALDALDRPPNSELF